MSHTLQRYQERLTDFSSRNSSYFLSSLSDKNHFDASRLLTVNSSLPLQLLTEHSVRLVPVHPRDDEESLMSSSLKKLFKEVDSIEKEIGKNTFYISYGLLEGEISPKEYVRSPILLIPARLSKTKFKQVDYWVVERQEDEEPLVNRALIAALRHFQKIDLEILHETIFKDGEENLLLSVQLGMRDLKFEVTFETEDLFQPFESVSKKDATKYLPSVPRIRPFLILGKFQQSSTSLLKDYDQMIKDPPSSGLFAALTGLQNDQSEVDYDFTEVRKEEVNKFNADETYFVLETDASQEAAVLASRERKGLIIQGPPGTGKSQVIANLVVDRLMRNEKVLVVCQKSVALQVVHNRLGEIGLNRQSALVAKPSEDRPILAEKILNLLEMEEHHEYPVSNATISFEIDQLRNRLDCIAKALYKKRKCGRTLRNLYTVTSNRLGTFFDVLDLQEVSTETELDVIVSQLCEIAKLAAKHDKSDRPWSKRKSFASAGGEHELRELLSNLQQLTGVSREPAAPRVYEKSSFAAKLQPYFDILSDVRILGDALSIYEQLGDPNQIAMARRALETARRLLEPYREGRYLIGLSDEQHLQKVKKAANWMDRHSGSWLRFLNPMKKWNERTVELAMNKYAFGSSRELADAVSSTLAIRNVERLLAEARIDGFSSVSFEAKDMYEWVVRSLRLIEFLSLYRMAHAEMPDTLPSHEQLPSASDRAQEVVRMGILADEAKKHLATMARFFPEQEAENLIKKCMTEDGGTVQVGLLLESLDSFEEIKRLDTLKEKASPVLLKLIERCKEKLPVDHDDFSVEAWAEIVKNSFRLKWIAQAEEEDPHIMDVSMDVYEEMRQRFRLLLDEKQKETPLVLAGILARKAMSIDPKRRHSLRHEAGKRSRRKTIRQLFNEYPDEFFKLFPVWLCTPDAVSSLFPLKDGMFDLVIFDEASQLPVENALPAILRAKHVVVAGDEMQLPPADYFTTSVEDDEEDEDTAFKSEDDRFAKSLLEWCKPKMPHVWLTTHYRSAHDALINFSNHAFYSRRMDVATPASSVDTSPIRFESVEGRWLSGTNRKEAERVANLVIDTLRTSKSQPTIGIVAMNDAQAKLIDSLLDSLSAADTEAHHLIESARNCNVNGEDVGLFVKNIENVQGDEREIIIFSATYAPDEHGEMPSRFGKLSSDLGGNILNVAVTRAKKKMIVVCSFDPSQWLRADGYKKGVRLYKRYLQYAKAVSEGDLIKVEDILHGLGSAVMVQDLDENVHYDSPFEEEVRTAILALGYKVHTQVGFSGYKIDLGVISKNDSNSYLVGVECDGAMYHSSKVARERDYYRQRFLERKGWRIFRIWSRNWWKNKEDEIRKLDELLKELEFEGSLNDSASVV